MSTKPTIVVIIGITGDLSTRKLLPAIAKIAQAGAAPQKLQIVGITRRTVDAAEVLGRLPAGTQRDFLDAHLEMYQMDLADSQAYQALGKHLRAIEQTMGGNAQCLFYLSVPPQVSQAIVRFLGESGLADGGQTKLLLEKPFGVDLASAHELIAETKRHFSEDQLYRIDHYVAKEMAQNLVVFRQCNSLFRRTWNSDFIARIDIIVSERIGIEGRAAFYEQTGALRDMVQSHLLQLAALTLMEVPSSGDLHRVTELRLQALRGLHVPPRKPVRDYAIRGQYEGYRTEIGNPHSATETYVHVELMSTDPRWHGVPICLMTGKSLAQKTTEIRITYQNDQGHEANQLIIRLQPNEGVALHLWTKVPGYEWQVEDHALELAFKERFKDLPEPYEQVFLDAINSNHTLFTSSDEVLETWRILEPIQKEWALSSDDIIPYAPGSEGPRVSR